LFAIELLKWMPNSRAEAPCHFTIRNTLFKFTQQTYLLH